MAEFKIGDKVVAPTVFKGIGEVVGIEDELIAVLDNQNETHYFYTNGYWCMDAELPALHHYKEPGDKMNCIEAFHKITAGKRVYSDSYKHTVYFLDENDVICFFDKENPTEHLKSKGFDFHEVQANWYIYKEQEEQQVVEWTPKKYDSVLVRNKSGHDWRIAHYHSHNKDRVSICDLWGDDDNEACRFCVPFKDNEHLLGTKDEPSVKYVIKGQEDV